MAHLHNNSGTYRIIDRVRYRATLLRVYTFRASALAYMDKEVERLAANIADGSPYLIRADWRTERAILSRTLSDARRRRYDTRYWIVPRHRGVEGDFWALVRPLDKVRDLNDAPVAIYCVEYDSAADTVSVYDYEPIEAEQTEPIEAEQTEPIEAEQTEPIEATADAIATRYTIYIGLNDSTTRRQEVSTDAARGIVANAVRRLLGYGTITEATGVYTHDDGEAVTERTLVVTVTHDKPEAVNAFAEAMRDALHQESVYIERDTVAPYYL